MNTPEYKKLMAELKADYLASFPTKFANLQKCFDEQDWPALEQEFHKLKGTGKTYGIPEVSTLCQKMEDICRDKVDNIPHTYHKAIDVLKGIKQAYLEEQAFDLDGDPRYLEIVKFAK